MTIAGTVVVTPAGTSGFTTKIASPTVHATGLRLSASGLTGQILGLLQDNLDSTIQKLATQTAETAMEPLINDALGALGGPQRLDVLGNMLDLQGIAKRGHVHPGRCVRHDEPAGDDRRRAPATSSRRTARRR